MKLLRNLLSLTVLLSITQIGISQDVEDWVVDLHEAHIHNDMPYRIMKPLDYNPGNSYPVIVSLHGGGGRGTDNLKLPLLEVVNLKPKILLMYLL